MKLKVQKWLLLIIMIHFISLDVFALKLTSISDIQGTKKTSGLLGQLVMVEGVVTADFQNDKSFAGFFIQSIDSKKTTGSVGLFVHHNTIGVEVGDIVHVSGRVVEHKNMTQLNDVRSIAVLKKNQELPDPAVIELPLKEANLENLEGMRVTLKRPSIVTDHYNYIKYGEFVVSSQLLMNPTNNATPGENAKILASKNANDRLLIDDGSFVKFKNFDAINNTTSMHIGAKVQVVGVLHYAFDQYRIMKTQDIIFSEPLIAKFVKPDDISGEVKIASFNLKNYFTTIDGGKDVCGPEMNFGCRGADTIEEFERQQRKILSAIEIADADIFALQEIENHKDTLINLVDSLNKKAGHDKWSHIATGILGEDVIRVGLIYKIKKITPIGKNKVLNSKVMPEFEADKNREVLLQSFKDANDNLFNVAVVHLKSKRCTDALAVDLDQGDGQGCYNSSRSKVADQISQWMNTDPTGNKARYNIILGDFNAYSQEEPLSMFDSNGFYNLSKTFLNSENFTSIYRGVVGSIDHILVNKNAKKAAKGMYQWHINSIVMGWFDYNLEPLSKGKNKPDNYFNESPFASSDHDIVIAGFTFND